MTPSETTILINGNIPSRNKILVVDDEPLNVKLISAYLEKDYNIIVAYTGEEALKKVEIDKPDIVLLDIMMPEVNGYDVCKKIKQLDSTRFIPVVMITALSDLEAKIKSIEIGADDFLTKPINHLELITRVKSSIKTKMFHDQLMKNKEKLEKENKELLKEKEDLKIKVHERTADLINAKLQFVKKNLNKGE
jgi:PleD family two-component response regulator